ncbi:MAG: DEAD/DEAH box helicase [Acidilobaceae archaeon]|nr:DEAD/DEAH box helicase [Acidilobaceae archaeon]MCX8165159.1 DEAD/DEAH box helicase [Acidilobaceae archaeon]MDW7974325.1 DEAD/DEAH box helicase [Sulfolobales archaeon]
MRRLGYSSFYPPQAKALEAGIERGESVIVSTPTASGKTLVGLIAIVNSLLPGEGKAFYTAPLRSIAMEKREGFRVLEEMGYQVGLSIGDYAGGQGKGDVVVTTYEKLDSMIRNDPNLLPKIKVLVVDEVHYVGDEERGPVLESLLARVLSHGRPQVVGLSATVPNAKEIADWIGAKLVEDSWRPVPLYEGVYKEGRIYYADGKEREVRRESGHADLDLVIDSCREGGQSIVFSQSRRRAVQLAGRAARLSELLCYDRKVAREAAAEIARSEGPRVLREELYRLILSGVSYHHAGLSNEQRKIIEEAFRRGGLAAIYSTPTLAAGVNLPARRVVVEEYYRFEEGYRKPLSVAEYKQLAGRAGRPGLDPYGEAIIVATSSDEPEELLESYAMGEVERVESRLTSSRRLRHMVLGLVTSGLSGKKPIYGVLEKTLYSFQSSPAEVKRRAGKALEDLKAWGLVEGGEELRATPLGHEVSRNYLDPLTVPTLREAVERIKGTGELELSLLLSLMPDMTALPVSKKEEEVLMEEVLSLSPQLFDVIDWQEPEEVRAVKVALILRSWVEEVPEDEIAEKFNVGPGDIAVLVDNAVWIASGLSRIVRLMDLPAELADKLKLMESRIKHGVKPELLPLVAIPRVGRFRARRLYSAGYRGIHDLLTANPEDLLKIPGIGPQTVRAILDFLGREEGPRGGWGLEGYIE